VSVTPVGHHQSRIPAAKAAPKSNKSNGTKTRGSLCSTRQAERGVHLDLIVSFEHRDEHMPVGGTAEFID
jgi:hypothetical protein